MTTTLLLTRQRLFAGAVAVASVSAAVGFAVAELSSEPSSVPAAEADRKILYWYDPMVPGQHFDKPGKSPYMDMELVPRYADEADPANSGLRIPTDRLQQLGVRYATVRRGTLSDSIRVSGTVDFNQRDLAIVQARAGGFVQRVYARAPGDIIGSGAPLADILVPDWGGAQSEYIAVRRTGNGGLIHAARQRLLLLGMSPSLVASVERSGRVRDVITIASPTGGAIQTLGVRAGMTVTAGQTLAEINGLDGVWLNAALPEALAGQARIGAPVRAFFTAFPGEPFAGRVTAILPQAEAASRTLTLRVELRNRGLRLRPGMFASVELGGGSREVMLVPTEAVIRTGRRNLVMLAGSGGRFLPAEVEVGRESGGQTEVIAGLTEGERIVASGQFLIDSEASLAGMETRPVSGTTISRQGAQQAALHEAVGRIELIEQGGITISHQPVPAIGWPAMTMRFRVVDPALSRGLQRGQQVRFAFEQAPQGPTVRRIAAEAAR